MKNLIKTGLILTFAVSALISCKKPETEVLPVCALANLPEETAKASITGKWNIVTDSTSAGVGVDNHLENYTGKTDDYFDFRNDGKLYIKEGLKLDTSTYKLTSDSTILISSFGITANGVKEVSHITNLTAHSVTINAPIAVTPGGLFGRKVNLSR